MKQEKNKRMKKTIGWILRVVVDIDAFNEWIVGKKFKSIKHQAQQFGKKIKKKSVCEKRNNNNGDAISQELCVEQQCEDHSLVFAMRDGGVGGVLFVVGVAGGGRVRNNKKKKKVCKIMVDMANKELKKMKVRYEVDELSDKKVNKKKKVIKLIIQL